MPCCRGEYADELINMAAYIGTPGKVILAAYESTDIIMEYLSGDINNAEALYKHQIYDASVLCGVLLLEEDLKRKTATGKPFVAIVKDAGFYPGIKLDKGTVELARTNGETTTQGLDDLAPRCAQCYADGARFATWRAVLKIGTNHPSQLAIDENARALGRYAIICQENGLVPIVEIDILADGAHDIEKCADVTERVLNACHKALIDHHVLLEGTLLKPNLVTPGSDSRMVVPEAVAEKTLSALQRTVPSAVPAVMFSFCDQYEEEATVGPYSMNQYKEWSLFLSFGRALQQRKLEACFGKEENVKKTQNEFHAGCRANYKQKFN